MKRILNILLLVSFIVTVFPFLTGEHIHKLASTLFLLMSLVHTVIYRKKLGLKRWILEGAIIVSFISGIFGMILEEIPAVLIFHRAISIILVFFLSIHIFVFHKKLQKGN